MKNLKFLGSLFIVDYFSFLKDWKLKVKAQWKEGGLRDAKKFGRKRLQQVDLLALELRITSDQILVIMTSYLLQLFINAHLC